MTQTQKAISWSMEDVYNLLMRGVEPDLCTDTLHLLDTMYEGETSEEKRERMQWYSEAFKQFLERYQKFTGAIHAEFQKIHSALRTQAESKEHAADADVTHMLEQFFDSGDAAS